MVAEVPVTMASCSLESLTNMRERVLLFILNRSYQEADVAAP